jgi:hypothetical protein
MKACTACKENKEFKDFGKAKFGKDGLRAICKKCHNSDSREWQKENLEKIRLRRRAKKEKDPVLASQKRAVQTLRRKEKLKIYDQEYRKNNPGKSNAKTARRRAQKRAATPKWLTEDHWTQIEIFYIEAAKLTQSTGIPHEVDHIEPVMGKDRKGLHVPWNLRVITRSENRHKSRKVL